MLGVTKSRRFGMRPLFRFESASASAVTDEAYGGVWFGPATSRFSRAGDRTR
jgi:hypothetical protein